MSAAVPAIFEKADCQCCYVVDEVDLREFLASIDDPEATS